MKLLVKNENARYSSEVIRHGGIKFKIVAENSNAYCNLNVYVFTKDGGLELIANRYDIPNALNVDYLDEDEKRKKGNAKNIRLAEEYIKLVYSF